MTHLYDGMAGIFSDVLGAPVTYLPRVGEPVPVQSIFRREPVEAADGDGGSVWITSPSWRVTTGALDPMPATGDRIQPGDGRTYRITAWYEGASPASDAFILYELEREGPP